MEYLLDAPGKGTPSGGFLIGYKIIHILCIVTVEINM